MRRQLFLLHLRRSVTNVVIVFVAVLAVIYIVERITRARAGEGAAQVPEIVNMVLIGGLILAAFPVGSAAFGKSFREQQALFLYSLPVRRIETWAILVGAAATSYLLLLATAALVRPSLIGMAFDGVAARDVGNASAVVAFLFASGACLALAAPRQAVAIASGLLLVGPSIGLVTMINADRFRPAAADEAIVGGSGSVVGVLLLTAIFLLLSALFYVRGEHELLSQVALRYAAVVGSVILAGALVFAATALADRRAPMRAIFWDAVLSPGGEYVAVVEAKRYIRYREIRVFDTRSGRELFRRRSPILDAGWTGDDRLLVVDSTASVTRLMLSLPFETRATFFRPDGTVAATRELPAAMAARLIVTGPNDDANAEADPLLILESYDSGRSAFHLFTATASSIKPVGRGNGGVWATTIFDSGKRVLVNSDRGLMRVFRAGDTLEEIRWNARPSESRTGRHYYLLDGLVHPTEASALEALSAAYPIDGALRDAVRNAESGGYLFAKAGFSLLSLNPVRYLVRGTHASVWEWGKDGWVLLTDSIEMPKRRSSARDLIFSLPETAAAAPDGTILFTKQEGEATEVFAASAAGERSIARVDFSATDIWVGWARREKPALVSIVLRNSSGFRRLIADLARNAVVANVSRGGIERELDVRADGTRVGAIAHLDDDHDDPQSEGPVKIVPRRRSFSLVEVRPDGTRRETRLGE